MQSLRPAGYQLIALTKLLRNGQNAVLIADGVGVGKTIAAGYILAYFVRSGMPGLVLAPPGLLEKWRLELRNKFGLVGLLVRTPEELSNAEEAWNHKRSQLFVYIVASSVLSRSPVPKFPGIVVIDEIHAYRNASTALWNSARSLTSEASHRVGLSATPINNKLEDIAAELALLLRVNLHVAEAVTNELWRPKHRRLLYPLMTRFVKERLGIHFAHREIIEKRIELSDIYVREAARAIKNRANRPDSESIFLDEITYFRLATSSRAALEKSLGVGLPDSTEKVDALQGVLNRHKGEHVIVFCQFEATATELQTILGERPCFRITGDVPVFDRQEVLERFRVSGNGVLVMTAVGSEGLDLQFCSVLVNYDLTWNPMVLEQRIGRIDRIGQEKAIIHVYNFVIDGSIDDRILQTLGKKLGLVKNSFLETAPVIGGKESYIHLGTKHGVALGSDEVLADELRSAKQLKRVLSLTDEIIPEDYSVLPYVREEYCSPDKISMAQVEPFVWLPYIEPVQHWLKEVDANSYCLKERLSYYNS